MSTIDDIATWAYSRLNRTDLQATARDAALGVYRMVCAKVPFPELQATSAEIPTVANQVSYALATLLTAPALRAISSIRLTVNSGSMRRLRRSHTRVYDATGSRTGIPATYARWGTNIELNPTPNASTYTFRIRYWSRPTIVVSPNEHTTTLVTPLEWDELLKYETLYRLLIHLEEHDKAAMLVMVKMTPTYPSPRKEMVDEAGIIPKLWNDLLTTVEEAESSDEDFSVNPVVRSYNY